MLKIDAHSHAGEGAAVWNAHQIVERMDTMGVDKTVIFPFTEGFFNNDEISGYVNQYPERLIPFCAINAWDVHHAADELEKCYKAGFKGLKLHPALCGFRLSDKKLVNPLFQITEEYGGVIIAHGASDLYNCPLEFDRIAKRFPKVPLIMAHCGFFWEWELAIEIANENQNLYLETSRVPGYETGEIINRVDNNKIIWGTDGPFADYEWEYNKIARYTKTEEGFKKIIGENIARLLHIN